MWAYVILEEDFLERLIKNYTKNMRDHTRYLITDVTKKF